MRIVRTDKNVRIYGEGNLVISTSATRNCLLVDSEHKTPIPTHVEGFHFVKVAGRNRLTRLICLIRFIWPYTK